MVSGKEHLPIAQDVPLAAVEDQVRRYTAREIPAETTPKPGSGTSVKEGSR
jgi:hypothetical protein